MGDQGNVIQSKGFQFTICQAAFRDVEDGHWRPEKPEKPTKAKDTWIYAIGYVLGQKGKLAGEYYADKNGALTFVPGDTRRNLEPDKVKKRTPKPEAGLPVIIQEKPVRYSFVATRGQLGTDAIWDMENSLPRLYGDFDLADSSVFVTDSNNQLFLPIVDPLSIGEGLNRRYQADRDKITIYKTGKPDDENDQKAADAKSKKYQLAKMIKEKLYDPPEGSFDPLGIGEYLAGSGKALADCVSDYEKVIKALDDASRYSARRLVAFLNTPLWIQPYEWYLESTERLNIGHYWLEATSHSINRLGETPEGRALFRQMIQNNVPFLRYFFRPDEDYNEPENKKEQKEKEKKEDEEQSEFYDRFLIARKAATAGVIAFGELAPAMVVYSKVREAAKRRVIDSISLFLSHTEIRGVLRSPSGDVVRLLHARIDYLHIEINWTQAKADLTEWVEQGKPHWPESKANDVIGRMFIYVELFNLASCLTTYFDARRSSSADEKEKRKFAAGAVGALLDFACAMEDPIRGIAKEIDANRAANRAFHDGVDLASEGGEAEGILTKLTHPVVFKAFGAISAAIDFYYSFEEVALAKESGEQGMVLAKRATQVGSAVILGASILNGAGYLAEAALLTAASSALLVLGVFIVAVGWALTAYFSKSMWQKFAKHCTFGIEPAGEGKETWSGGEFSEWTSEPEGLIRQIKVLTAMTCSFKISGTSLVQGEGNGNSSDWESISVEFSALPPGAKLHLFFELTYESGNPYYPEYALDLESGGCTREGPGAIPTPTRYFAPNGAVNHVVFSADRPDWAKNTRVKKSACTVFLQYAPKAPNSDVATGVIPVGGHPCRFVIYDGYGVDLNPVSSLEYKQ